MDFPITDLMDEQACYDRLVGWLHPDGFVCPRCHAADRMVVHRRGRDPVLDFRCGHCKRVFNVFTGTALHGAKRRPRELVLILRGFAQGVPTAQLARELGCDRPELLGRTLLQGLALDNRDRMPLDDPAVGGARLRTRGKRRAPHHPEDRCGKPGQQGARGHGTWE
jgi:hypothetical protein